MSGETIGHIFLSQNGQNGHRTKQVVLEYILQVLVLPAWPMADIAWKLSENAPEYKRNCSQYTIWKQVQSTCICH